MAASNTPNTLEFPTALQANGATQPDLINIIQALEIIHTRTTTNELRKQASEFLESQKHDKSAVQNGFYLAAERNHSPLVRHFGLSLLEHILRHRLSELSSDQIAYLRELILGLVRDIQLEDLSYIRNKLALLWVEIAKRTWALDWRNMDENLVQLWGGTLVHKEFVLGVLEMMSDDVFYREDTASSLRGAELNRALVEICTPHAVFKKYYPERTHQDGLRYGEEGWTSRITALLNDCVQNLHASPEARICAQKALATLRSMMTWSIPSALSSSQCVQAICLALTANDENILMVSVIFLPGYTLAELKELHTVSS